MPPSDIENSQSKPAFTGERFIPHQTDPFLALEHYHRYCFASRFAQGKRILDIGCGEGYGSAFLSQSADAVVGIDRDQAIIDHARKKYSSIPNLTFEVGNCQDAPSDTASFDMAVSFELLEHLDSDDQVRFLKSVRQRLKPDGMLVISSPEKNEYAVTYPIKNEFHKHELTIPELKAFLDPFFKHVHLCAQRVLFLSTVWQLEGHQRAQFRFHARKDLLAEIPSGESFSNPLYLIALCSNAPLPENVINESNSFYLDIANSDQAKDFLRWAQQLNSEAQKNRERIQDLQKQLEERTEWTLNLDNRIKAQNDFIETLQKELQDRATWALDLDNRIKAQNDSIETLQKELEDRAAWALDLDNRIKAQNDLIETLQKELEDRAAWALDLDNRIKTQNDLIETLQKELEDRNKWALSLSSSLIYRALSKLKLLPSVWGK